MPLDRLGIGKLTLPYGMDNDTKIALEEFATRVDDNVNYLLDKSALNGSATGGTGSAGAGKQYVSVKIGGVSYKLLHDGTV